MAQKSRNVDTKRLSQINKNSQSRTIRCKLT
jgi:hypothetical protein